LTITTSDAGWQRSLLFQPASFLYLEYKLKLKTENGDTNDEKAVSYLRRYSIRKLNQTAVLASY
jgi:hypothetical protein